MINVIKKLTPKYKELFDDAIKNGILFYDVDYKGDEIVKSIHLNYYSLTAEDSFGKKDGLMYFLNTLTPEFKRWFSGSKVVSGVDENYKFLVPNTPMVLYHMSDTKFKTFNTPAFFSDNPYAYKSDYLDNEYVVYLNIKNPLELRSRVIGRDKFVKLIKDILVFNNLEESDIENRIDFAEKYADSYGLFKIITEESNPLTSKYRWDWIYNYLKSNNYDGFVMRDSDASISYTITTYVPMNSNQIKSVTSKKFNSSDNIYEMIHIKDFNNFS